MSQRPFIGCFWNEPACKIFFLVHFTSHHRIVSEYCNQYFQTRIGHNGRRGYNFTVERYHTEKFEVSFSRWKSFKVIMNTKRTILINLPRHLEFKVNFTRAFHLVIIFYGFIGCFCLVLAYVVSEEDSGNETTCHFFQCSSNIADHEH